MNFLTLIIVASSASYVASSVSNTTVNATVQEVSPSSTVQEVSPSSTVSASPSASASPTTPSTPKTVKFHAKVKLQLLEVWNADLANKSSSAYTEKKMKLQEAIGTSLKKKTMITDATFMSGSVIADITVVLEEELKTSDAVPSNFIELFKKAIESGKLGNFTVNSTYTSIEEKFEDGVSVTKFDVKEDECKKTCCPKEEKGSTMITQYRTCTADPDSKCQNVITKLNVPCSITDCCSSAGDLLMSPLITLLALALIFSITG